MPRQSKRPFEISEKLVKYGKYKYWLVYGSVATGKKKKRARTYEEAEKLRDELNEEFYKHGRSASDFTQGQKVDAAKAFGILDGRASLEESAEFWILHHPVTGSVDIEVAIKAYLEHKRTAGRIGEGYAKDLATTLNRFSKDIKGQVSEVTESTLKEWFEKSKFGISAKNAYIRDLKQFFGWCGHRDRRWSTINPCEHLERQSIRREDPIIYTPEEARSLMAAAWEHSELEMTAWYGIGLFSGVRVEELGRVAGPGCVSRICLYDCQVGSMENASPKTAERDPSV